MIKLAVSLALGVGTVVAQQIQPITIAELLAGRSDSTRVYVRNFWATWCKPCIEELPIFDTLARRMPEITIELVSLDAPADSIRVRAFWQRRGFGGVRVLHLVERLRTKQIDAISPVWSGAIPMTIVERGAQRIVHEGELTLPEAIELIEQVRK
ncbi:MAG: hypothetical protein KatS3mg040_0628 [Candidatus Kapaibacterium sp.]|nr:MAG: hypothetical protein KatS3mg040_0628 [Candidatus Kapabacteria bacterium]